MDDDPQKVQLIIVQLRKLGVPDEDIYVATCAVEARKALNSRRFRLLLLDLNIPVRNDSISAASAEVGAELLREIVEDLAYPSPENIIGITADPASMLEYEDLFRKLTSQILLVAPGESDWKYSLEVMFGRIKSSGHLAHDVDICFLSALRAPEQSEILRMDFQWTPEESLGNGILFRRGRINIDGKERRIISAHCPQMGMVTAATAARILIEQFKPRLLFMNGICGGVGDKPRLGDLVVAEKSWDWQSGKWLDTGEFEIAPDSKEASSELTSLALGLDEQLVPLYLKFAGNKPEIVPKTLLGPMVSGSAVVADASLHKRFISQHRKSTAVDMECYGLYLAVHMSTDIRPKVLCIKAVADLADRAKADHVQEYCSYISAQALLMVAERYFKAHPHA